MTNLNICEFTSFAAVEIGVKLFNICHCVAHI